MSERSAGSDQVSKAGSNPVSVKARELTIVRHRLRTSRFACWQSLDRYPLFSDQVEQVLQTIFRRGQPFVSLRIQMYVRLELLSEEVQLTLNAPERYIARHHGLENRRPHDSQQKGCRQREHARKHKQRDRTTQPQDGRRFEDHVHRLPDPFQGNRQLRPLSRALLDSCHHVTVSGLGDWMEEPVGRWSQIWMYRFSWNGCPVVASLIDTSLYWDMPPSEPKCEVL